MGKQEKIELTPQELEEIKDTIRFRECVVLKLKQLKGIPDTVNSLKTQSAFQWAILAIILASILAIRIVT